MDGKTDTNAKPGAKTGDDDLMIDDEVSNGQQPSQRVGHGLRVGGGGVAKAADLQKQWGKFREAHSREEEILEEWLRLLDHIIKDVEEHATAIKTLKELVKKASTLRQGLDEAINRVVDLREKLSPTMEKHAEKVAVTPIFVGQPIPGTSGHNQSERSRPSPTSCEEEQKK